MESAKSGSWFEQFRSIILAYNEKRQPDPFMQWFKKKEEQGFFADDTEKILAILIDARFDQMTTAEKALANTKLVAQAGCLKGIADQKAVPVLIPRQYFSAEAWTKSFVVALPRLLAISNRIVNRKTWMANELYSLMISEIRAPYLGVKTSRLAIRWLYELMPNLNINMDSYEIPIDRLVYRVSCRLGLIDPNHDKYSGQGSDADIKIQTLVRDLLPGMQWIFDEPLWSTGRKPISGGHCYPKFPSCSGCIFGKICPHKFVDFDPAELGMQRGLTGQRKEAAPVSLGQKKQTVTPLQAEFAEYVEELRQQGIHGEEYREKTAQWRREHL